MTEPPAVPGGRQTDRREQCVNRRPRVLFGLLWSGEPQLRASFRSALTQQGVDVGYFVIAGRGKREAHTALYELFHLYATSYDILIKLDGDMVILTPALAARAHSVLELRADIDVLLIPVLDHLTGRTIVGMHVYRPGLRWRERSDNLFTDANDVPPDRQLVSLLGLEPVVDHCREATPFQAFHFGVHRGVKLREALRLGRRRYVRSHARNLRPIWRRANSFEPTSIFALWGLALALSGRFSEADLSYSEPAIETEYQKSSSKSEAELRTGARRLLLRALIIRPGLAAALVTTIVRDSVRSWTAE